MGRWRGTVLLGATVAAVAAVFLLPRIPQDPAYHRFADPRTLLGVPSFTNVVSGGAFVWVGVLGLRRLAGGRGRPGFVDPGERWAYRAFFAGLLLTGVGSAYYHLAPDDGRLVWDRLPMTLAFMALVSAVVAEHLDVRLGRRLLVPLLGLGLASVVYWHVTEAAGRGDLRPYAVVQFGPMALLPLACWLYPPRYTRGGDLLAALGIYAGAKGLEALDGPIFRLGGVVGGHALKHLAAALAAYWLLRMLTVRRARPPLPSGAAR